MNDLIAELDKLTKRHRTHGELIRQRLRDWVALARVPAAGARGGGVGDASSDDSRRDWIEDRNASRYLAELEAIEQRMFADARRHNFITALTVCEQPRRIQGKDMLATQVAAEGWCVSCWRNDQHLVPIERRPNGDPYYRDLCRFCGGWKAEHGQIPAIDVIQRRHDGRRITRPPEGSPRSPSRSR